MGGEGSRQGVQEWKLTLYLCPELYMALIKMMADRGQGRSYAGLCCLIEGLYKYGYLSDEQCTQLLAKYSEKLGVAKAKVAKCLAKGCKEKATYQGFHKTLRKTFQLCDRHFGFYKELLTDIIAIKEAP
jgi:hypothetical protein